MEIEQSSQNVECVSENTDPVSTLDAFLEKDSVEELIKELDHTNGIILEASEEKFIKIIDKYQEQPHLLDPHLDWMLQDLINICRSKETSENIMHQAFKYLRLITKTRGYKVVVRHLPHEVSDFEPTLNLLAQQDPTDVNKWEIRYMLLLWLSIIIMIPFHLSRLDNLLEDGNLTGNKSLAARLLEVAQGYLSVSDKSQDAAAYLISKFITRPDAQENYLPKFLNWALQRIRTVDKNDYGETRTLIGIMKTIALLFKHGRRDDLQKHVHSVLKEILQLEYSSSSETQIRKIAIKILHRIGLIFLKPRIAGWRYQRGMRSLAENLSTAILEGNLELKSSEQCNIDEDNDYDIPEEIEVIIEHLLTGLKDKDNIVRWSAAKGIGRISGRLPKELVDEVVGSLLEFFTLRESDNAWHGGCLALAELGRRGLLLPQRLKDVVPVIMKALVYDVQRGNFSVGSNIRDAACYVCWSFARAYDPQELVPFVPTIASSLLVTAVFDREINCRRAAAAAFQENVGRQGTFPHGIDIVTTADYFAVGMRSNCYLNLSVYISKFPEYTVPLISHLLHRKINHWDKSIRELAAKALHNMTPCAFEYMAHEVVPQLLLLTNDSDIQTRHGSIIALGEIIHALAKITWEKEENISSILDSEILKSLENLVMTLQNNKAFKGLGGELSRQAANILIEKLSLAKLQFSNSSLLDNWQQFIDECLAYDSPTIQTLAVNAFVAFCNEYYQLGNDENIKNKHELLIERYLNHLHTHSEYIRIGFGSALGKLPVFMLKGNVSHIIEKLIRCCNVNVPEEQNWAEARKTCITSVVAIFETVGLKKDGLASDVINEEYFVLIMECLIKAMQDYTTDNRGDIGALVREASMSAFYIILTLAVNSNPELISPALCKSVMTSLAQQAVEKIIRIRAHAINIFLKLLHSSPIIPNIPHYNEVLKIFPQEICQSLNYNIPGETIPFFTELLAFSDYMYSVLLGLTVSMGELSQSQVRSSSNSLLSFLKRICEDESKMQQIGNTLIQILEDHVQVPRVCLPYLKMMDQLLTSSYLNVLILNSECNFSLEIFTLTQKAVKNSKDVIKIMAAISVFCGLFQSHSVVRERSLKQVMIYLCHKYPRVRKDAANKLYEAFITYDDLCVEENQDEVLNLILETAWDNPVEEIQTIRNKMCNLLNVPVPKLITNKK